jgi:membrane-associated phospholipid phosphatase
MIALTDFGDPAVLLPIAFLLLLWLLRLPNKRAAAWWAIALALCIAVTASLKIYLYPCPEASHLRNPSGHVSLSVFVYGGIATILGVQLTAWRRIVAVGGIAAFVIGISVSRILLDAHTTLEVGLGLMIGLFSLILFGRHYRPPPAEKFPLSLLVLPTLLVMLLLHGETLYAEDFLHHLNAYMGLENPVCP